MRMYTCEKPFKTTLFDRDNVKRIEIKSGTDWFVARKENQDRIVLSNNKIEIIIGEKILKDRFRKWG